MKMNYYALTGPGYTIDTCWGLARHGDGLIERYDKEEKQWVVDDEMCQIYTGDIECDRISEEKAYQIIKRWEEAE